MTKPKLVAIVNQGDLKTIVEYGTTKADLVERLKGVAVFGKIEGSEDQVELKVEWDTSLLAEKVTADTVVKGKLVVSDEDTFTVPNANLIVLNCKVLVGNRLEVEKSKLVEKIVQAEVAKLGVEVTKHSGRDEGKDIFKDRQYVTATDLGVLDSVIDAAKKAIENEDISVEEANFNVIALEKAIVKFEAAKKYGNRAVTEAEKQRRLKEILENMQATVDRIEGELTDGTVSISVDGGTVPANKYWMVKTDVQAIKTAIKEAKRVIAKGLPGQMLDPNVDEIRNADAKFKKEVEKYEKAKKPGKAITKEELQKAIEKYVTVQRVNVSEDGEDVLVQHKWVTPEVDKELTDAKAFAEEIKAKVGASQVEIDKATDRLLAAIDNYKSSAKYGKLRAGGEESQEIIRRAVEIQQELRDVLPLPFFENIISDYFAPRGVKWVRFDRKLAMHKATVEAVVKAQNEIADKDKMQRALDELNNKYVEFNNHVRTGKYLLPAGNAFYKLVDAIKDKVFQVTDSVFAILIAETPEAFEKAITTAQASIANLRDFLETSPLANAPVVKGLITEPMLKALDIIDAALDKSLDPGTVTSNILEAIDKIFNIFEAKDITKLGLGDLLGIRELDTLEDEMLNELGIERSDLNLDEEVEVREEEEVTEEAVEETVEEVTEEVEEEKEEKEEATETEEAVEETVEETTEAVEE